MRLSACLALLLTVPVALACDVHQKLPLIRPKASLVGDFWVSPGVSGAWFNPDRSGEGWLIEMQPDGTAVAVWFTHAPEGEDAGQRWIVGQGGRVVANRIEFDQALTFSGAHFGPEFNPADVMIEPWGTLAFEFDDCANGRVTYAGRAPFGAGEHAMTQLIGLNESSCSGGRALTATGTRAAAGLRNLSGTWFDPAHNGEGLILQALSPTQFSIAWFTYTDQGEPAWLLGIGQLADGRITVESVTQPQGARFGAAFDPASVQRTPWGQLQLDVDSCSAMRLSYQSVDSRFGSGSQSLQRLTSAAGADCLDSFPAARTGGSWSQGPTQPIPSSEVATTRIGSDIYVAGDLVSGTPFQRFNTVSNAWTVLPNLPGGRDHALAVNDGRYVYVLGGYRSGGDNAAAGWRFDPASSQFQTIAADQIGGQAASGAAALNGWFYLGDIDGSLTQYDPRSGQRRRIAPQVAFDRDHANVVAYLGEIWLMGGRDTQLINNTTVSIYDPASETWRYGPPLLVDRSGFGATVIDQQILIGGGERLVGVRATLRSVEMIAAGAQSWLAGPDLPIAVHGVGAASVNGRAYLTGGSVRVGGALNNGALQIYQPSP